MSKVSVIIAAFNVEKYITQTLNSVIAQTLKDIEIIVVDDCSTDGTSDILARFAELDRRVKVITQPQNKSSMQARKTGFAHATGEYIMFLDGDDMLKPYACEEAYRAIVSEDVDLLQFDTEVLLEGGIEGQGAKDGVLQYLHSYESKRVSISRGGLLDCEKEEQQINFTVWNKIYRRESFAKANEQVPNEYLNIAEDVLLSFLVQFYAKSYAHLPRKLCSYRYGSGVTNLSKMSDRKISALGKTVFVYSFLRKWVKEQGAEKECALALRRVQRHMLANVADTFYNKVDQHKKNAFVTEVMQYCTAQDMVLALHEQTYRDPLLSEERIADECAGLDLFSSQKTEIKTVGVYYYRIRNGGVENVLSELTDTWVKRGYRVVLFTDEKPSAQDYYVNPDVVRVTLPAMLDSDFTTQEARVAEFYSAIQKYQIDVMVYNAWVNTYLLLDEMIIKSCGVKLILHTHGLFCFDIANENGMVAHHNSALSRLYALADSVITLNDVDTAWWQAFGCRCFKTRNPIKLTPNVKTASLQGNRVLFVGRISPEKQILDVLKIADLVRQQIPDVTFSIVGTGDDTAYEKQIKRYMKDNELQDNVVLEGFQTNMLPYYQSSDVMLCTSKYEGFSLALTESKMCGLPLVAYSLPNWDLARAPKGMINVPQGDVWAAADAIVTILSDSALKLRMGAEAREDAEALYSLDLAAHWDMIFAETLKPKPVLPALHERSPLETAVNIATDFYTRGLWERGQTAFGGSGDASWSYYAEQCRVLSKALKELGESESYRIGLFVTAIPRKIKNWLDRKKKK